MKGQLLSGCLEFTFSFRGDSKTTFLGRLSAASSLCFLLLLVARCDCLSKYMDSSLHPFTPLVFNDCETSESSFSFMCNFLGGRWGRPLSLGVCRSPYPGNWRCLFLRTGLVQKEKSWGEDTEGAGRGGGDGTASLPWPSWLAGHCLVRRGCLSRSCSSRIRRMIPY